MAAKKPAPAKQDAAATAPAPARKTNLLLIILIAVVLTAGLVGGGLFFVLGGKKETASQSAEAGEGHEGEEKEEDDHAAPAVYVKLEPAFIVNLADPGKSRYLQADVTLMTRSDDGKILLEEHMPLIRNALLMLLSQQQYDVLVTLEGKQKLQQDALVTVGEVLKTNRVTVKVEELLFTSLIMQ